MMDKQWTDKIVIVNVSQLESAFEDQLAGAFSDETSALKWLDDYLNDAAR